MAVAPQFTHSLASDGVDRGDGGAQAEPNSALDTPPPHTHTHTSTSLSLFGDLTAGGQGQCSTKLGGGIGRWIEGAPGGRKEGTGKVRTPVGTAGDRD